MWLSPGNPFWHPDHDDPPDSVGQPDHEDQRSWTFQQVSKGHHHHHHGRGGTAGWGKIPIFQKIWNGGLSLLIDYLTSATLIVIISVIIIIYHYFTDYPTWPPWTWAGTRLWRLNKELLRELTALMRCKYLYLYLELNLRERTVSMRCE